MKALGIFLALLVGLIIWLGPIASATVDRHAKNIIRYDQATNNRLTFWFLLGGPASGFSVGWVIFFIFNRIHKKQEKSRADDSARLEKETQRRMAHNNERKQLESIAEDLSVLHGTLEPLLDQAGLHVTHAKSELADDSAGPFWDEIEGATRRFAQYNNGVATILRLARDHSRRRSALPAEFQPSPLETRTIPDGDHLLSRMSKIVKQARRNPQWETIFQQRRTNDILVRGFENLGNALESLQDTISSGFSDLAHVLHSSVDRITSEHSDRVITELNQLSATHSEDSRERRRFEQDVKANADKAVQVLEKIENRRRHG